jgi:tRNA-splicing ligase RtcB
MGAPPASARADMRVPARMSRTGARREITGAELRHKLEAQGIVVRCPSNRGLAEEAPFAYKDVERGRRAGSRSILITLRTPSCPSTAIVIGASSVWLSTSIRAGWSIRCLRARGRRVPPRVPAPRTHRRGDPRSAPVAPDGRPRPGAVQRRNDLDRDRRVPPARADFRSARAPRRRATVVRPLCRCVCAPIRCAEERTTVDP